MNFIRLIFTWIYQGYKRVFPKINDADIYGIIMTTSFIALNFLTIANFLNFEISSPILIILVLTIYLLLYYYISKLPVKEIEDYPLTRSKRFFLISYVILTIIIFIISAGWVV